MPLDPWLSTAPPRTPGWLRLELPVDELRLGMRVVRLDRPWTEVPIPFQNFCLETELQLRILRQHCLWVEADVEERWARKHLPHRNPKRRPLNPPPVKHSLDREMPRAAASFAAARRYVDDVAVRLAQTNAVPVEDARPVIRQCVSSIMANPNALFWLTRIKNEDQYTAEHCLRVAVLATTFGHFLRLPAGDLEILGLCGLLHDIGKLRVPAHILNKPGSLTPEELVEMRRHPEYGANMLRTDHPLDSIVTEVALGHHERMDGQGYPAALPAWQISRFTRIISIVDAYDAITSDRCYRRGRTPDEALRILYRERSRHFDSELTEIFIRMIGLYPPGSLVELNTGEIAVVHASNPNERLRPRIEVVLDAQHRPIVGYQLDLAENPVDEHGQPYQIRQTVADGSFGWHLQQRIADLAHAKAAERDSLASRSR